MSFIGGKILWMGEHFRKNTYISTETVSTTTIPRNTKEALSTTFHYQIHMTEKGGSTMNGKTPEQQIEELKTGIGAMGEMIYMFYSTLIFKGFHPDDAIKLTDTFVKSMVSSLFRKEQYE